MLLKTDDPQTKALIKETLIEIIQEEKGVFYDLVLEAMEDIAMTKAIQQGRKDEFVSEERIFSILENNGP